MLSFNNQNTICHSDNNESFETATGWNCVAYLKYDWMFTCTEGWLNIAGLCHSVIFLDFLVDIMLPEYKKTHLFYV